MKYKTLSIIPYWNTIEPGAISRLGVDGPKHPAHLYAIQKYIQSGWSLIDIGCGSGSTWEAIRDAKLDIKYLGVDNDQDHIEWCQKTFPEANWDIQDAIYLKEENKTWDVAFSRGTIENLPSFVVTVQEMTRVAKKLIIVWFWQGFTNNDDHTIQRFVYGDTLYPEFQNKYSRKKIVEEMKVFPDWRILEISTHPIQELTQPYDLLVLERINN